MAKEKETKVKKTTKSKVEKSVEKKEKTKKEIKAKKVKVEENVKKVENNFNIKKTIIIIIAIIAGIAGLFCLSEVAGDRSNDKKPVENKGNNSNNNNNSHENDGDNPLISESDKWDESEQKDLTIINFNEFEDLLKKDTLTVVMLGTDTCYWCINQKPVLEHVLYKNDVNLVYLNVGTITEDDYSRLAQLNSELNGFGTPTFISVKKGKVISVESGARDYNGIVDMLKEMGAM